MSTVDADGRNRSEELVELVVRAIESSAAVAQKAVDDLVEGAGLPRYLAPRVLVDWWPTEGDR